ncbi:MAG: hypothetical protein GAK30_03136 [Paracidovorax wautersii]|uniref:ParB-like nuclease n=1 Tax=Paracidovorax wautersii TaxID=1177982 RepID=A0A7V8JPD0_9BURK|nr:MAG: hypothetical protein GAK30_03136 [Paracidovorax wautersii]
MHCLTPSSRSARLCAWKWLLAAAFTATLSACGGSDSDSTSTAEDGGGQADSPYLAAKAGDVLKVRIDELHPTQPSVGYDQIYYNLGRKQPDLSRYTATAAGYLGDDANDNYSRYLYRTERKRVDDYCADNGQGGVAVYQPGKTALIDPSTYACQDAPPTASSDAAVLAGLKTVVIGPAGALYLTDGHHTFTALKELADGGDALPVWVRVSANYGDASSDTVFWQRMQDSSYVWLKDAAGRSVAPADLPQRLGLSEMADDPYRSLVYFTRGLGYSNDDVSEFAEFNWGEWLRDRAGLALSAYDLTKLDRARVTVSNGAVAARAGDSTTSYVAAVRDASMKMVALADTDVVANGKTAADLGKLPVPAQASDWNDLMEEDVWRTDTNSSGRYRSAGKAWYALKLRACGGAANTQPACWLQ